MFVSTQMSRMGYAAYPCSQPTTQVTSDASRLRTAAQAARDSFGYASHFGGNLTQGICEELGWSSPAERRVSTTTPFQVGRLAIAPVGAAVAALIGVCAFVNPVEAIHAQVRRDAPYGQVSCWDDRTHRRYSNDPPSLVRFKFAALLIASPLLFPVMLAVNVGLLGVGAIRAASRAEGWRAAQLAALIALAPAGSAVMWGMTCLGLLMPLEARALYAGLERHTRAWPTAPCFQPCQVRRPLWGGYETLLGLTEQHGLGGVVLSADGNAKI